MPIHFTGKKGFQGLKELSKSLSKHLTLKLAQAPGGVRDIIDPSENNFLLLQVLLEILFQQKK